MGVLRVRDATAGVSCGARVDGVLPSESVYSLWAWICVVFAMGAASLSGFLFGK